MSKAAYQRTTIADRILGGMGGAFLGFVVSCCLLALVNYRVSLFYAIVVLVISVLILTIYGICCPGYPMRWSQLVVMVLAGDENSDLPRYSFICHALGLVAMLLLLVTVHGKNPPFSRKPKPTARCLYSQ